MEIRGFAVVLLLEIDIGIDRGISIAIHGISPFVQRCCSGITPWGQLEAKPEEYHHFSIHARMWTCKHPSNGLFFS